MSSYVDNVRKNIAGQGRVEELASPPPTRQQVNQKRLWIPPEPKQSFQEAERLREETPSPPPPLPPPPMELLETDPLSYTAGSHLPLPPPSMLRNMHGTYHAEPYRSSPGSGDHFRGGGSGLHQQAGAGSRGARGSTGSSPASTSPSPPHCSPTPPHQQVTCCNIIG